MASVEDEELDELGIPPTPTRVYARALVLAAVVARGFLEQDAGNPDAEQLRLRVRSWLTFVGASTEVEPKEQALLQAPLGTVPPQQAGEASWRCEGLAVLAWALGQFELPPYDQSVEPKSAADAVSYLQDEAKLGFQTASLRSSEEIAQAAAQAFAIHWRLRDFTLNPKALDFEQFARDAWFGPLDVGRARFVDGDLAIGELSISEADEEDVEMCAEIIMERHQALNWLMGQNVLYSEVTADT